MGAQINDSQFYSRLGDEQGGGPDKYMYVESTFICIVNNPQRTIEIRLFERKSYSDTTLYEEVPLQDNNYTLGHF